jgi:acyl transferase domain-containing protein/acyl carrier protein
MADRTFPPHAVAIVGLGGRFPGAADLEQFWRNLMDGVDVLQAFSDDDLAEAGVPEALRRNPAYVRAGTVLEGVELFDAGFFGLSPREAQVLDPQQRMFLECAWEALEHAGYIRDPQDRTVGVYAGVGINTYLLANTLTDRALVETVGGYQLMLANDKDFLSTRVSYKLDLRGPSMTIQTACSTSLVAVIEACRALERGECDMALAGGVAAPFPQRAGYLYQEGMILSPDGLCRPFDAEARGTRPGAGAGIVVLKRLADAIADRDTIHAVIRGGAVNNDGAAKAGYTAPSIEGQVEVIATALALADVPARSIGLVEAHGTGTPLGDPIEIAALTAVYRSDTDDVGFCRLGSVKANLGHLDAAAGVAGLIKATLSIENDAIPPLAHFNSPNPALMLETSPFAAGASPAAWPKDGPRRAGVSSFGIGGTNAHVVIEQAPPAPASSPSRDDRLLLLSARTPEALDAAASNLSSWIKAHPKQNLADVEWTLQAGRRDFLHRRAVVVGEGDDAAAMLAAGEGQNGIHDEGERPVVFLFSGQGSQHAEMGAGLYRVERVYREAFDACVEGLKPHLNLDLREVVFGGDAVALEQTAFAQPALFAMEYALGRLWMSWGVSPAAMIGHSIGEYAAACLAGVFSLDDALKIVAARGRAMQDCPPGAMAAVPMAQAALSALLPAGIEIAAENGPELCAVAGPAEALDALVAKLAASGVDARRLHVSHAFHSEMMAPALVPFRAAFEGVALNPPSMPYISTLTGAWITDAEATSPDYYVRHLRGSVRFASGLRALVAAQPAAAYVEVGPNTALSSLARGSLPRDAASRVVASMRHPKDGRTDTESMLVAVGRLWLMGALAEPAMINGEATLRRTPLPTYPFERQRYWVDAKPAAMAGSAAPAISREAEAFGMAWSRQAAAPAPAALHGRWLVVGGPPALNAAVLAKLQAAGASAAAHLAAEAVTDPGEVAGAVLLVPLNGEGAAAAYSAYQEIVRICEQLETWGRAEPARVLVASAGVWSILDEAVGDHHAALALGPVLSLPYEAPGLTLRHVDVAADLSDVTLAAAAIASEAGIKAIDTFSAWRHGRRFTPHMQQLAVTPGNEPPLQAGAVVLITGGLGGVGQVLAQRLAASHAAKVALVSRRASPEASAAAIAAIEARGGQAMVVAADVTDRASMAQAIAQVEAAFGKLDGVIHGAGSAGSGSIAFLKQEADVRAVIAPKVDGLDVLVDLLGGVELPFFATMSSINAVVGAPGLSDYCGANAVLDAFVEGRARPAAWRRVLSIGWGPWGDVGMAARRLSAMTDNSEANILASVSIAPDDAADIFERLLASDLPRAVVSRTDLTILKPTAPSVAAAAPVKPRVSTAPSADFAVPAAGNEAKIAEIWTGLLGVEAVGATDDFFTLGGHSLLATRVLARIGEQLGVRLALRDIFEAPTVRMLAKRIAAAQEADDREEFVL